MKKKKSKKGSGKAGIKYLPIYDIQFMVDSGHIEAFAFRAILDEPDGLDALARWRNGIEETLTDYDRRWISMCNGDMMELMSWGARMMFVRTQLNEIDRNLAVREKPRLFNKEAVGRAWGMVNAFRVAAEQMLDHNEA